MKCGADSAKNKQKCLKTPILYFSITVFDKKKNKKVEKQ